MFQKRLPTHIVAMQGITIVSLLIFIGTIFYTYVEGMTFLDAFYLAGSALTTVGFGDIVPITPEGKIFTVFYSLAGITAVFFMVGQVISSIKTRADATMLKRAERRLETANQKKKKR
jgi:voltage-gated potassium channel Kch